MNNQLKQRSSYLLQHMCKLLLIVFTGFFANISYSSEDETKQIEQGKRVYKQFCSLCHGMKLQGQPNWRERKPDGKLPAPPHDETGHTWHHPDQMLFDITKYGLVPPNAPENYKTDMPAWESTLNDEDIWAVLAYIKSHWSEEIRQKQGEINDISLKNR